jgi:hypothetical protein
MSLHKEMVLPALVSAATGLVNDKAENLALFDVVKANNTDEAVAILRTTRLYFAQHFLSTSSTEQRQFPQCPVVYSRLRGFVEFDRWNVALIQNVLNLLGNLSIGEGRKVGKGFVTTLFW